MIESAVHIAARVGDEVVLRLDRQGVGGYLWTVVALPDGVTMPGEPEREVVGAVGGGSELVCRLRPERPGSFTVICEHRRPWGGQDLAERRTFTVVVSAS